MNGKIYFASDFHLGVPDHESSLQREKKIVEWLDKIRNDAEEIILLGDLFDFWFEYNTVVPKGFVRFLGKLAHLSDSGIKISVFTGNHDIWMFDYFEKELNIPVYRKPQVRKWNGKKFYIAHGDGLGPGDQGFKFLKAVFTNKFCQRLFNWLHPDIGVKIALFWSARSRIANSIIDEYKGDDKEWLVLHSKMQLEKEQYDYFIYGHRHIPIQKN